MEYRNSGKYGTWVERGDLFGANGSGCYGWRKEFQGRKRFHWNISREAGKIMDGTVPGEADISLQHKPESWKNHGWNSREWYINHGKKACGDPYSSFEAISMAYTEL